MRIIADICNTESINARTGIQCPYLSRMRISVILNTFRLELFTLPTKTGEFCFVKDLDDEPASAIGRKISVSDDNGFCSFVPRCKNEWCRAEQRQHVYLEEHFEEECVTLRQLVHMHWDCIFFRRSETGSRKILSYLPIIREPWHKGQIFFILEEAAINEFRGIVKLFNPSVFDLLLTTDDNLDVLELFRRTWHLVGKNFNTPSITGNSTFVYGDLN